MERRTYVLTIEEHKEFVDTWIEEFWDENTTGKKESVDHTYKKNNDEWVGFAGFLAGYVVPNYIVEEEEAKA